MIDSKVADALNKQINQEMTASYHYYAMSAHFEQKNLGGFASWMMVQRNEELAHADRLYRYVLDRGGEVVLEAIEKPRTEFDSIRDVFQFAFETEKANTLSINELYTLAKSVNDYATLSHLQWFIDEQVEEEKTFDDALALIDMAGDDRSALILLNEKLGARQAEPAAE